MFAKCLSSQKVNSDDLTPTYFMIYLFLYARMHMLTICGFVTRFCYDFGGKVPYFIKENWANGLEKAFITTYFDSYY